MRGIEEVNKKKVKAKVDPVEDIYDTPPKHYDFLRLADQYHPKYECGQTFYIDAL